MSDPNERLAQADQSARARGIIALFQHPIREDRHRALAEVVEMGDEAIPALISALDSDEKFVRQGALRALGQIASPDAIPGLQDYVIDHEGELGDNRAFAMQALAAATSPTLEDRPAAFKFLRERTADRDDFVRAWAFEGLGRLGDPRAKPLIERGSRDRDPFVAEKAAGALVRLAESSVAPTIAEMLSPEVIEHRLQSREAPDRELALRELRRRIDELDYDPVPLVLRLLHGPNRIGRRSALEAVNRLDLQEARGAVLTLLENDHTEADIVANALRALAGLGDGDGSERLLARARQFLAHQDLFVRSAAVAALSSVPMDDALPFLTVALGDGEAWIRDEASQALARNAGPALEPYIGELTAIIILRVRSLQQKVKGRRPKQEVQTVARLVLALIGTVPHRCDQRLADEMAPAGYACLAAPAASLRLVGLDLLSELVHAGAKPKPPTRPALRNLAAALTSSDAQVVESALDVLDAVLPGGSSDATTPLISVLQRGERSIALQAISLLGRAKDEDALEVLRSLRRNPDSQIADAAAAQLPQTGGWDEF